MRASTYIVLFFVFFNAGAGMLQTTGVAEDLGINADIQAPDQLDRAQDRADKSRTGQGTGSTLFGLYSSIGNSVNVVFNTILPGMAMLKQAGVPSFFTNFLSSGLLFLTFFNIASFLRGVDL